MNGNYTHFSLLLFSLLWCPLNWQKKSSNNRTKNKRKTYNTKTYKLHKIWEFNYKQNNWYLFLIKRTLINDCFQRRGSNVSTLTRLQSKWKAVDRCPLLYCSAGRQSTQKYRTELTFDAFGNRSVAGTGRHNTWDKSDIWGSHSIGSDAWNSSDCRSWRKGTNYILISNNCVERHKKGYKS